MAKTTEAQLRAQKKYDDAHKGDSKSYHIKFNRETDADIIECLERISNKNGFIKTLIRDYLKAEIIEKAKGGK